MDPRRLYSLVQSGSINLALGASAEALSCCTAALAVDPGHVPAACGAAAALLSAAHHHIGLGAPGIPLVPKTQTNMFVSAQHCKWGAGVRNCTGVLDIAPSCDSVGKVCI
jgi:hypothetical protein